MDRRLFRFRLLNSAFLPHLERVLARVPEDIREKVLDDDGLQLMTIDSSGTLGQYLKFDKPIETLLWYAEELINESDMEISHTVAHEIAHWVADKGETGLYEKEAEELLEQWGFEEEVKKANYDRPLFESNGYKIGYGWAKKNEDKLWEYEGYLDEWSEGKLSTQRLDSLLYDVDVTSVLDQMGNLDTENQDPQQEDKVYHNEGFLEKGVVWGIMSYLHEKKRREAQAIMEEDMVRYEFIDILEKINTGFSRLFDHVQSMPNASKYWDELQDNGIADLYKRASEFLERVREEH